jgi:hypothetical protein
MGWYYSFRKNDLQPGFAPLCCLYCDGGTHPAGVQTGQGLPSAKLGTV